MEKLYNSIHRGTDLLLLGLTQLKNQPIDFYRIGIVHRTNRYQ